MLHQSITADWTQSLAARRILSSFAKHPPKIVSIEPSRRWDAATVTYAGYRVECLRRLHNEAGERVLTACDAADDYRPFGAFCDQPTVDQAIDAALAVPVLA